jgi:hypothetical protein
LDGEIEVDEVRCLCCAGVFDAEPCVARCGAGIGVLTWEKRSKIGRCGYGFGEGGVEKRQDCKDSGNDNLRGHHYQEKQTRMTLAAASRV